MHILRRFTMPLAAVAAALTIAALAAPSASAHERRTVAGKYTFVVGFLTEPVLLDEPNGIDLRITNAETNEPVLGVEKTLKADMIAGGQTKTVDLKARFGQQGAYTAELIPTKTGTWAFRFFGTIDGQQIDERFESGPGRFNDVQATADLQFPTKVPSISELAAQVERGAPAETAQTPAQSAEVQKALDRADSARTMGIALGSIGIVAGLLGAGLGLYALTRRQGGAGSGPTSAGTRSEPI